MKEKLKKLQLLFCTSLAGLLLFSCNMQDDTPNSNPKSDTKVEKKSYAELIKIENFSRAMNLIPKQRKATKIGDRTMMEDKYTFTIYDTPINVTENDTLIAYNLLVKSDTIKKGDYFENLVINFDKRTDKIKAFIVKFNLTSEITQTQHDSFYFESELEIYEILYNDSSSPLSKANTVCYQYHYITCTNDGHGGSGGEHIAGPNCKNGDFLHDNTIQNCTVSEWEPNNFPGNENMPQHANGSYGGGHVISTPTQPCNGCPPAVDLDNTKPCEELKKLSNTPAIKTSLNTLQNHTAEEIEFGFGVKEAISGTIPFLPPVSIPNDPEHPKLLNTDDFVDGFIGQMHSHPNPLGGTIPMFSGGDIVSLFELANQEHPTTSPPVYEEFFVTLGVKDCYNIPKKNTFAIKIKDWEKLYAYLNIPANRQKIRIKLFDIYSLSTKKAREDYPQDENTMPAKLATLERNLLDVIKELDLGIGLYIADADLNNWSELKIDPLEKGTQLPLKNTPCN